MWDNSSIKSINLSQLENYGIVQLLMKDCIETGFLPPDRTVLLKVKKRIVAIMKMTSELIDIMGDAEGFLILTPVKILRPSKFQTFYSFLYEMHNSDFFIFCERENYVKELKVNKSIVINVGYFGHSSMVWREPLKL